MRRPPFASFLVEFRPTTALEKSRRANALSDYKTTAGKGTTKTPQLDAARDRLETLTAAESQAITEVARLTDRVAKLERLSELQSALNLVERRGALCQKIADGIKELIPLFDQYHNDAEMFVRLSRSTSAQVRSQWRLRNFLAPAANSRPFGPARR
jgi:hypothetical protein